MYVFLSVRVCISILWLTEGMRGLNNSKRITPRSVRNTKCVCMCLCVCLYPCIFIRLFCGASGVSVWIDRFQRAEYTHTKERMIYTHKSIHTNLTVGPHTHTNAYTQISQWASLQMSSCPSPRRTSRSACSKKASSAINLPQNPSSRSRARLHLCLPLLRLNFSRRLLRRKRQLRVCRRRSRSRKPHLSSSMCLLRAVCALAHICFWPFVRNFVSSK